MTGAVRQSRWSRIRIAGTLVIMLMLVAGTCKPQPEEKRELLVGLADFHNHQFAHLGFGGTLFSHGNDPTTSCLPILTFDPSTFRVRDLVRHGLLEEASRYAASGHCAATYSNGVSQRVDTASLKRAWEYGLRLMVMLAVSSEYLCAFAELASPCPSDRVAIEAQIQAAKALEAKIAAEDGGWYRIVTTPDEARTVIREGKLAVVLGIETASAFGCQVGRLGTTRGVVPGGPFASWEANVEDVIGPRPGCTLQAAESGDSQIALASFERYFQLGVRHFFPIHNMDGIAGGTALSIPLLHATSNPSRLKPGGIFNRVDDIDRTLVAVRPQISSWDCSSSFEFDGGRCNSVGLTPTGRSLIRLMADYGMLIDIDHMSLKAKREVTAKEGGLLGGFYPVVSSHSGIHEINWGDKKNEGQLTVEDIDAIGRSGGAIAPYLIPADMLKEEDTFPLAADFARHECPGTSESFVQAYRYVVNKLEAARLQNGRPAFVGVGIGSDLNTPIRTLAPRFQRSGQIVATEAGAFAGLGQAVGPAYAGASQIPAPGACYGSNSGRPRVSYPFKSPKFGGDFPPTSLPWTGRTFSFDISVDGVVHVGMIPDFVQELRELRLTDQELEPLWRGAEAYIRAWENARSWVGDFSPEHAAGTRERCANLRAGLVHGAASVDKVLAGLKELRCHGFS